MSGFPVPPGGLCGKFSRRERGDLSDTDHPWGIELVFTELAELSAVDLAAVGPAASALVAAGPPVAHR